MDSRSGEMLAFTKVVETGSFSAAGTSLKLTASAVSKLITRIEERLGVLLLQRSTRLLTVTADGKQFYESCVRILADIDEAEHGLMSRNVAPSGIVSVNVSLPFGNLMLLPLIPEFSRLYPDIILDLSFSDAMADLHRDSVDVAIRMGPLADASFQARMLGRSRRAIVASPSYIDRHGKPDHPHDLGGHRCFNFNFKRSLDEWPFRIDDGTVNIAVHGGILTNNGETMRQLTLDGMGISRLGMFHIAEDLKAGRLVELLFEYNPGDIEEMHVIYSSRRHMPSRIRVFIDFLVVRLGPLLRLDA